MSSLSVDAPRYIPLKLRTIFDPRPDALVTYLKVCTSGLLHTIRTIPTPTAKLVTFALLIMNLPTGTEEEKTAKFIDTSLGRLTERLINKTTPDCIQHINNIYYMCAESIKCRHLLPLLLEAIPCHILNLENDLKIFMHVLGLHTWRDLLYTDVRQCCNRSPGALSFYPVEVRETWIQQLMEFQKLMVAAMNELLLGYNALLKAVNMKKTMLSSVAPPRGHLFTFDGAAQAKYLESPDPLIYQKINQVAGLHIDINRHHLKKETKETSDGTVDRMLSPPSSDTPSTVPVYSASKRPSIPINNSPSLYDTDLNTYLEWMKRLLHLEEVKMIKDLKRYDMYGVKLQRKKTRDIATRGEESSSDQLSMQSSRLYKLEVPGMIENRPSISIGDTVLLRPCLDGPDAGLLYPQITTKESFIFSPNHLFELEAVVMSITMTEVTLLFPPDDVIRTQKDKLEASRGWRFVNKNVTESFWNIRFTADPTPWRYMHYAVQQIRYRPAVHPSIIFPALSLATVDAPLEVAPLETGPTAGDDDTTVKWFNESLNKNQKAAVLKTLRKSHMPYANILYGPPGTGKTMTVIEMIQQILRSADSSTKDVGGGESHEVSESSAAASDRHDQSSKTFPRILVSCPSDSAVDTVCIRLAQVLTSEQMVRLSSWKRKPESLPVELLPFSPKDDKGFFMIPEEAELHKFSVIACTCICAGTLLELSMGIPFTHIIVDESCQAMEAEILLPLHLALDNTSVTLAGDPRQLGALIRSSVASEYLSVSLQERLMSQPPYSTSNSVEFKNNRFITTLDMNYRSHGSIIQLSSDIFYESKLLPCGDPRLCDSLLVFEDVKDTLCPVLFYGVAGDHLSDGDNGSIFNPDEALKVVAIIEKLLKSTSIKIGTHEIGVVTPYRKQVFFIRNKLRSVGLKAIRVGTVEDYQGQEARCIIISTVVSKQNLQKWHPDVGIFKNPKQFNVALTRAQALSIVVGNPEALYQDVGLWRRFINYAVEKGSYRGTPFTVSTASGPVTIPLVKESEAAAEGGVCDKNDDDDDDMESFLRMVCSMNVLGSVGDTVSIYPTDLDQFYRDDIQFRVFL